MGARSSGDHLFRLGKIPELHGGVPSTHVVGSREGLGAPWVLPAPLAGGQQGKLGVRVK